jgi:hypothetical protein
MKTSNEINETDWVAVFNEIKASDLPEVEKVAQAFRWLTSRYMEHSQQEIELLRAMSDRESLVKEQIKLGVMKHTRGIFHDCYKFMIGRRAWDERDNA